jgi:hypothetical protein
LSLINQNDIAPFFRKTSIVPLEKESKLLESILKHLGRCYGQAHSIEETMQIALSCGKTFPCFSNQIYTTLLEEASSALHALHIHKAFTPNLSPKVIEKFYHSFMKMEDDIEIAEAIYSSNFENFHNAMEPYKKDTVSNYLRDSRARILQSVWQWCHTNKNYAKIERYMFINLKRHGQHEFYNIVVNYLEIPPDFKFPKTLANMAILSCFKLIIERAHESGRNCTFCHQPRIVCLSLIDCALNIFPEYDQAMKNYLTNKKKIGVFY